MRTDKIRVLLVDDDTLLGSTMAQELNKRGYDTTYLSAIYGVAEAIKQLEPDVLVFDVEIGRENGIEVAMDLYKGNPSLPIIFISSHHEDEMKAAGLQAGGVSYLDKPFSSKLLSAHIDRFTRMMKKAPESAALVLPAGTALLDTRNRVFISATGSIIALRPMEFNILKKLVENKDEIILRNDMCIAIWGKDAAYYNEQSLNNCICRVRDIFEKTKSGLQLQLYRGLGYKLKDVEE